MGKVSIVSKSEAESRSVAKSDTPLGEAYRNAAYPVDKLPYFPVEGGTLELFHIQLGPDSVIESHAHTEDEIIYLIKGTINLGARILEPGDAIYVGDHTLYGFTAGPDGCEFLNFRAQPSTGLLTKEQFLAARKAARADEADTP